MEAALEAHRRDPDARPEEPARPPLFVEKLPTARNFSGCIHCHQAKELMRADAKNSGLWKRESVYTYPLPENVGITLDINKGNLIRAVKEGSPAAEVGIEPGDVLQTLNSLPINSFADAQYALHRAPLVGSVPVAWQRNGASSAASLKLREGWKWTNLTWRPSMLDLLPSLTMYGDDLSDAEKMSLGLEASRLAFRQERPVHSAARELGIQERDIIIGIDNKVLEMDVDRFLGYVRQNYLVGEEVTFNIIRNGKRMDVRATLK
jgi:S1-C subfamily serine protease